MVDCLVYWKIFPSQFRQYGEDVITPEWDTKYEYFPDQVNAGDNLWVIIRDEDKWFLIQRIYIQKVVFNEERGEWDIEGNDSKSEIFDVSNQPDFVPILHRLNFASGKKITKNGGWIGTQIQRPRPLSNSDVTLLKNYTKTLRSVKR